MVTLREIEDIVKTVDEIAKYFDKKIAEDSNYAPPEDVKKLYEISKKVKEIPEEAKKTAKEMNLGMDDEIEMSDEDEEEFFLLQFTLEMFNEIIIKGDNQQ